MGLSEHAIQKAYFDWARMHPVARRAYAIPNGGQRNKIVASKLKAEGVRKGVLDVHLPVQSGGCAGLWLEFKSSTGRLTPEQRDEAAQLASDGFCVAVCHDTLDAIDITTKYISGLLLPCVIWSKGEPSRSKRQAPSSS